MPFINHSIGNVLIAGLGLGLIILIDSWNTGIKHKVKGI